MARIHGRFNDSGVFVDKNGTPIKLEITDIDSDMELSEDDVKNLIDSLNELERKIKSGEPINRNEIEGLLNSASNIVKQISENSNISSELKGELQKAIDAINKIKETANTPNNNSQAGQNGESNNNSSSSSSKNNSADDSSSADDKSNGGSENSLSDSNNSNSSNSSQTSGQGEDGGEQSDGNNDKDQSSNQDKKTPDPGAIYVDVRTNSRYKWNGKEFEKI